MGDSLNDLLSYLHKADEGLIEFDPEKHKETLLEAEIKIDSYKYILNKYDLAILDAKQNIEAYQAIKKTLENKAERLKNLLLWIMKSKQLNEISGQKHSVKLCSKDVIAITAEPSAATRLHHPDLVKVKYSWDKVAFDKAFKNSDELKSFAELTKTDFIKFSLKRSV